MKKLIITCASILTISLMAANAQIDTTKTKESEQIITPKKDQVQIKAEEVPAAVRKTLSDPMYIGWENAPIYFNKTKEQYSVELLSGNTTKMYRFDKNGKPIIEDK